MDVETASSTKDAKSAGPPPPRSRKRARNICLVVTAVILGIVLLLVILGLTVFKPKRPVTTVNSVALKDLRLSIDITKLSVHLNITLDVHVSIKNRNKVGFKYSNSSVFIKYRGDVVGEAPVPAGEMSAGKTVPMNLTVTVMADRLLSKSELYSDVISGSLPLSTYTRVSGKVRVLFFKIHVVSSTTCDIDIDIGDRKVANQICHYKTKL
ncbi:hypothetical protein NMG60_11035870 [Bertholletia excelsa]